MNIRKTLQASTFSFIVLNLAKKAALHFFLIMLNYIYNKRSTKKATATSNAEHLKEKSLKH